MATRHGSLANDLALRAMGAAMLAAVWLLGRPWVRLVAADAPGRLTLLELAAGMLLFAGASGGVMLLFLGRHVLDEVELPARWRSGRDG